jgi:hypothetical protein
MGRDIIVQKEQSALCSKLWPHSGNVLQRSSDNPNIENAIDSLPFRQKFFMDNPLFVKKKKNKNKKSDHHGFDLGLYLLTELRFS